MAGRAVYRKFAGEFGNDIAQVYLRGDKSNLLKTIASHIQPDYGSGKSRISANIFDGNSEIFITNVFNLGGKNYQFGFDTAKGKNSLILSGAKKGNKRFSLGTDPESAMRSAVRFAFKDSVSRINE